MRTATTAPGDEDRDVARHLLEPDVEQQPPQQLDEVRERVEADGRRHPAARAQGRVHAAAGCGSCRAGSSQPPTPGGRTTAGSAATPTARVGRPSRTGRRRGSQGARTGRRRGSQGIRAALRRLALGPNLFMADGPHLTAENPRPQRSWSTTAPASPATPTPTPPPTEPEKPTRHRR
jgi:hypothetical protein